MIRKSDCNNVDLSKIQIKINIQRRTGQKVVAKDTLFKKVLNFRYVSDLVPFLVAENVFMDGVVEINLERVKVSVFLKKKETSKLPVHGLSWVPEIIIFHSSCRSYLAEVDRSRLLETGTHFFWTL